MRDGLTNRDRRMLERILSTTPYKTMAIVKIAVAIANLAFCIALIVSLFWGGEAAIVVKREDLWNILLTAFIGYSFFMWSLCDIEQLRLKRALKPFSSEIKRYCSSGKSGSGSGE